MTPRDMALAALAATVWGVAFVVTTFGLDSFSAPQLTALRFIIACLPALFIPRPQIPWRTLIPIGLTLFTGQFLLVFFAYSAGLPPGLASVTQQLQAFFTVLLAAIFLRDMPTLRQSIGMVIAFCGMGVIADTVGEDLPAVALGLAIAAALSWGVGNVLVMRLGSTPMFPLMVWLCLVPPLPALLVSRVMDPQQSLLDAIAAASWQSIAVVFYLGGVATILGFSIWARLLARYPAAMVAPFALLTPCVGLVTSALVLGERFSPRRYAGIALILAGIGVSALPVARRGTRGGREGTQEIDVRRPTPGLRLNTDD